MSAFHSAGHVSGHSNAPYKPSRSYVAVLQHKAKEGSKSDVDKATLATERLEEKIEQFEERIRSIYPTMEEIPVAKGSNPSDVILSLPSALSPPVIARLGLEELAEAEKQLRIGACFDFISKLKDSLGVRSFLTRHSRTQSGYNGATRNQDAIRRAEATVKRYGRSYRRSWQALDGLEVPQDERLNLQELKQQDMTILGQWLEGEQYRSRGTQLPWIWTIMPVGDVANDARDGHEVADAVDAWNEEGTHDSYRRVLPGEADSSCRQVIRLEWVHARAALARWEEELKLLKEEIRRVKVSFQMEEKAWQHVAAKDLAISDGDRAIRGYRAHAQKRSALYRRLSDQAAMYEGYYRLLDSE